MGLLRSLIRILRDSSAGWRVDANLVDMLKWITRENAVGAVVSMLAFHTS